MNFWRNRPGSNRRPLLWQSSILTNWTTIPFAVYSGYDPLTLLWQSNMIPFHQYTFCSSYRNWIGFFRATTGHSYQHTHELFCLSGGTRTHIELFSSFLIPNQVGGQLPTHLVILSGRSESNRLTDGSRPPVLKTLVTSRFNLTYKYTTSFF